MLVICECFYDGFVHKSICVVLILKARCVVPVNLVKIKNVRKKRHLWFVYEKIESQVLITCCFKQ